MCSSRVAAAGSSTWSSSHTQSKTLHCAWVQLLQVCDTIVTTVPKSVVHCLVRKAEKNLLNHMFGHVHKLSEVEIERMLQVGTASQHKRCNGKGTQFCIVSSWL